jgi:hypothetical protein
VHAFLLHKQLNAPIIVSGGAFNDESDAFYAEQAKQFLVNLGADSSKVIAIPAGSNTRAELCALKVYNKTHQSMIKHFEIVSSATHAYRISSLAKQVQLGTYRIHPVDQYNIEDIGYKPYWPSLHNLQRSEAAFYEYFAIVKMFSENALHAKPTCLPNLSEAL